jgi:hypothetical protein
MRIVIAAGTNVKSFQDCGLRIAEFERPIQLSTKYQAPNPKQIPMTKISNLKRNRFGDLTFGNYLEFEICDLEFQSAWFHKRAKS